MFFVGFLFYGYNVFANENSDEVSNSYMENNNMVRLNKTNSIYKKQTFLFMKYPFIIGSFDNKIFHVI
jgi:hypothetical protein